MTEEVTPSYRICLLADKTLERRRYSVALLHQKFLDTAVALGCADYKGKVTYTATGFLYGYPTGTADDKGRPLYWPFLVTNEHVIARIDTLFMRMNASIGMEAFVFEIQVRNSDGSIALGVHVNTSADIAVMNIDPVATREPSKFPVFVYDDLAMTREQAQSAQISEGDGVFVLGFPLGLAGGDRNYTIVRQGVLARVQDWLNGNAQEILIDSFVFPGNSGGPVFTKPEIVCLPGTTANPQSLLIGMIASYIPYRDVALSAQTGKPRITFEENSGLAAVVPYEVIRATIQEAVNCHDMGEHPAVIRQVEST